MSKHTRLTKTFSSHYDKLMPEDVQNIGENHFPTFKKHWDSFSPLSKNLIKVFPLALMLLGVFLTVNLAGQEQNTKSNAQIPQSSGVYGSGIGMDSLNNTQIGGQYAQSSSYRFRATTTAALNKFHIYIVGASHAGYGAGTGGTFEAALQTDDGTSNHAPSGTILATTTFAPGDGLITVTFQNPPTLTQGNLYHIVFRNIDSNPGANYASLDGIFMYEPTTPRQPLISDVDWGQPVRTGSGSWSDRNNTIPILQLDYSNGQTAGIGYMETWVRSYKSISGSSMARETFTVSGGDKAVSSFSVRLMRISGSSPLTVSLQTTTGSVIEQGTIPSSSIPIGTPGDHGGTGHATWTTYTFTSPKILANGQTYNVVLSSPTDTTYSIFVIRKGVDYGYSTQTYFSDGKAQYNSGSGWGPFTQDGAGTLDEGDLQFYFTTSSTNTSINSVSVSSIAALKQALADNTVDEIVVANGTYHVSPAANQASDSLWIGSAYAGRTRPITIRAQTTGGVTFDGGGATYYGCISFEDGAHDQTWDGFNCASGQATDTGIITYGGYAGLPAPHHITLKNIHILSSCTAHNERNDHAFYFSEAVGGPHDLVLQDITVDGPNAGLSGPGLSSAIHFYHSDSANSNAWNVTIQRLHVNGTYQALILWDSTIHNILITDTDINNAANTAVRYENPGNNITLQNIISKNSGQIGFYSSTGTNPPGITFINDNFDGKLYGPQQTVTPTNQPTLTSSPTPTPKPTFTPTPSPKPTLTPTPTLKPTSTPTPTVSNLPTATPTITLAPTVTPTPTLSNGQQKKCVKFFFFKFCF